MCNIKKVEKPSVFSSWRTILCAMQPLILEEFAIFVQSEASSVPNGAPVRVPRSPNAVETDK